MSRVRIADIALPILAAVERGGRYSVEEIHGTAFPLAGSALLTAAHVVDNVEAAGATLFTAWPPPSQVNEPLNLARAVVAERWADVDVALVVVPGAVFPMLSWDARPQGILTTVKTFGFPYGLDLYHRAFYHRALSGPIAGHRQFLGLPGRPVVYELQFAAPRGLSGAAILTDAGQVVGCVIGNSTSKMMVFSDDETVTDQKGSVKVERYEAFHLGIAVRSDEILRLRFDDSSTVRDVLVRSGGEIADGTTDG